MEYWYYRRGKGRTWQKRNGQSLLSPTFGGLRDLALRIRDDKKRRNDKRAYHIVFSKEELAFLEKAGVALTGVQWKGPKYNDLYPGDAIRRLFAYLFKGDEKWVRIVSIGRPSKLVDGEWQIPSREILADNVIQIS